MNKDLEKRAIENVVEYAAAIASLGGERRCRQPKKVEMFKLTDQYDDLWGVSDKCLYRSINGQCYRYPFDYHAFMAFHVLTRNKSPEGVETC